MRKNEQLIASRALSGRRPDWAVTPDSAMVAVVHAFGSALKQRRVAAGMRQTDLVDALDRVIARSTLANVEVGRGKPSPRLWEAIERCLPEWVDDLEPLYVAGRSRPLPETPFELAGPFDILQATYAYTFRDHRAPEEIVQHRRVRATSEGANGYGLQLSNDSGTFDLDAEALWGGWISEHHRHLDEGDSEHLLRFHFDHALRRGQVHDFATRSWVSHDDPADKVLLMFTRPTGEATLALNFSGPRPRRVWSFGPVDDFDTCPDEPVGDDLVTLPPSGSASLHVRRPQPGKVYGMAWSW